MADRRQARFAFSVDVTDFKWCYACGNTKPTSEFYASKQASDGLQSTCKECGKSRTAARKALEATEEWKLANPDKVAKRRESARVRKRELRQADPEKYNAECRAQYQKHADKQRERSRRYRRQNPEKSSAATRNWKLNNVERARERKKVWRQENREAISVRGAAYRAANKDKIAASNALYWENNREKISAASSAWKRNNKDKANAITARRAAAKKRAIPKWADLTKVAEFYAMALKLSVDTGQPHEVDHIVPLQSKYVCGLHVECNLQVIQRGPNRSKCNRYWPDMGAIADLV